MGADKPLNNVEDNSSETPKVSTNTENVKKQEVVKYFHDTSTEESLLFYHLIYQDKFSFDSINPKEAKSYLKYLYPILNKVDLEEIELIEIL